MANRIGGRTEPITTSAVPIIRGLEPLTQSTAPLDGPALAMEHVLASLARLEARLEATERRPTVAPLPRRPDPDPPHTDPSSWQGESEFQKPVMTAAVSVVPQPPLGFAGPSATRGPPRSHLPEPSAWERNGYTGDLSRGRHPTAWDDPLHRQEGYGGRRQTAWDQPYGRQESGSYSEPPRHDQYCPEKPHYEKMKPPRFDGSEAVNWISRVQYYVEHMGTPDDHRLHYVVMMFEGQASEWIFNYRDNNPNATWSEFLEDVRHRFDPQCFQNFIGLIAKLQQTGLVAEYNSTFETMLNRVRGVPEYILLPIYIEGLAQPVKNQVRHLHPASVAAAMALAVEYNSCIDRSATTTGFQRRTGARYDQRQLGQSQQLAMPEQQQQQQQPSRPNQQKFSEYSKLPVIRVSTAVKAERSRLGYVVTVRRNG